MSYYLGIDVSTTASKALLIDGDGNVVEVAATPHKVSTPQPLWSEQSPEEWWDATVASIRNVLEQSGTTGDQVAGIGLTGQMHGLVLLGSEGNVLRPALLWNDQRAVAECDLIRNRIGLQRLIETTGNDAFAGFSAPKLLWVRAHEPEVYAKIHHVLLPKDYIRYRLTGEFASDRAGGGGTLFLDLKSRDWSGDVLAALEIDPDWLPGTYEGTDVTGSVITKAATETSLGVGTPVVGGGGDQAAQAVGVGAVSSGIWGLTVGTSGVVFAPSDIPVTDPEGRAHAFPHAVPGMWHMMGVMLSAAGSLAWYHDTFTPEKSYDDLLAAVGSVAVGSEGLIFQPYLTGERTPHADPYARGSFTGITSRHGQAHFTRAVLEGVAFGLRDNFKLLRDAGLREPEQVRLSGGGARSPVWRQILADVLNVELVTVQTTEGAAYGAALLAGVGTGQWNSVHDACRQTISIDETIQPIPNSARQYESLYSTFSEVYPILKPLYPGRV